MQIHLDSKIRKKFHAGFERTKPIKCVVVHGTGGPNTLRWMRKVKPRSTQGQRYLKGIALFHYLIERDGKIWNIISPSRWVHHATIGYRDEFTIGIEMINDTKDNLGDYTQAQYDSWIWLFQYLYSEYPTIETIISHNLAKMKVHGEGKQCPGPFFDWKQLKTKITENWTCDSEFEHIFNIKPI